MSRPLRVLVVGATTIGLTFFGVAAPLSTASAAVPATVLPASTQAVTGVVRIAGASRIDTAIATSQDAFPSTGSAQAVVLTRSDAFPDALAGGPLAAKVGGPLLLTSPGGLNASVATEIARVAAAGSTVYILGGTSAVSSTVDTAITALGFVPKRVFGADRFATAVAIADQMGDPTTVFEATGQAFADALAAGPAAIQANGVILLTNGTQQSVATAAYLTAHPGGTHYAVGGPAAAADSSATPEFGPDRFWTAATIAADFFPTATTVGFATGSNYPDALAAGPDLAAKGAPLLLVPATGALPDGVTTPLFGLEPTIQGGVIFGGTASVGADVATQVTNLVTAPARAAADDASAAFTGAFGVLTQKLTDPTFSAAAETLVVDASSGDTTVYIQGHGSQTAAGAAVSRAQLAALPKDLDGFVTAVNSLFASFDSSLGLTGGDADDLFTINASQIFTDPVAPVAVRYETYAALASDDGDTDITANVKDSQGRVGIEIFAPVGTTPTDKSELSFIFDPASLLPLEDTAVGTTGAVVTRGTVESITTAATAPTDPYSS